MKRIALTLGLSLTASVLAMAQSHDAKACGGCFHPPVQVHTDITDERMLLSVSTTQTTLFDQIRYSGTPSSFAWVLPIHGTVDVGLSADVLFDSIDTLTSTTIQPPPLNCPAYPTSCIDTSGDDDDNASASGFAADGGTTAAPVTVTKSESVGPYETVQLHATDPTALNDWLAKNGYEIPAAVTPIVDEYVKEGFDFLAMKLLPNQGVQAMRPVRVTMPGASTSLPLRMAAIGTGATVGITIWVVSDGRYEPQNFPFYHIEDSDLVWDFTASQSNYTTLRSTHEAELKGKGWEIESSIDLNTNTISATIYAGGINASLYGGSYETDAGSDYLAVGDPNTAGGSQDGDGGALPPYESPDQVRDDDLRALYGGLTTANVRITRMRSDIAHAAMDVDFKLQASADQAELSNVRVVTTGINEQCPIYDHCQVVATGSTAQANAAIANNDNTLPGGCAIARPRKSDALRLSVLLGAVGLVAARLRRRRSKS